MAPLYFSQDDGYFQKLHQFLVDPSKLPIPKLTELEVRFPGVYTYHVYQELEHDHTQLVQVQVMDIIFTSSQCLSTQKEALALAASTVLGALAIFCETILYEAASATDPLPVLKERHDPDSYTSRSRKGSTDSSASSDSSIAASGSSNASSNSSTASTSSSVSIASVTTKNNGPSTPTLHLDVYPRNIPKTPLSAAQRLLKNAAIRTLVLARSLKQIKDVVYVTIDVEAQDTGNRAVTEVAVTIHRSPSCGSRNTPVTTWFKVKEHFYHVNKFVLGGPQEAVLENPHADMGGPVRVYPASQFGREIARFIASQTFSGTNIVLVGHSLLGDIKWVESLPGFDSHKVFPVGYRKIDIREIDAALTDQWVGRGLRVLEKVYNEENRGAHTAAGDADVTARILQKMMDGMEVRQTWKQYLLSFLR